MANAAILTTVVFPSWIFTTRDKGEKLGQPFNKEQRVSNNSSNSTQAEERSLQSALSHGPCLGQRVSRLTPQCQGSMPLRLTVGLGCVGSCSISVELGAPGWFLPFEAEIHLESVQKNWQTE